MREEEPLPIYLSTFNSNIPAIFGCQEPLKIMQTIGKSRPIKTELLGVSCGFYMLLQTTLQPKIVAATLSLSK